MANGTLKVSNIQTSSGSGTITLGQSGETVVVPNGLLSGQNYPAFEAKRASSDQSVSDNSYTKVQFNSEIFDTDSAYDSSTNYRFTPQVAGKYFVYASVIGNSQASSNLQEIRIVIYKNGSFGRSTLTDCRDNYLRTKNQGVQAIIEMNGSTDYLEIYTRINDTSGDPKVDYDSDGTYFGAYRIGA